MPLRDRGSGVTFDEFEDVPSDVREALQRGETILAIKRFRQATGAGPWPTMLSSLDTP